MSIAVKPVRPLRFTVLAAGLCVLMALLWAVAAPASYASPGRASGAHKRGHARCVRTHHRSRHGRHCSRARHHRAVRHRAVHAAGTQKAAAANLVHGRAPAWTDAFGSGDFRSWDWWGQGDPTWAHIGVQTPAQAGIPGLWGSSRVARFETTPDDILHGRDNAKLYKGFATGNWPNTHPPADVSGTYSAWYYLPTNYRVPALTWVNLFQFKEKYHVPGGDTSDPLWWIQLGDAQWAQDSGGPRASRPDAPVAFLNYWNNHWTRQVHWKTIPLGRWFEIKAVVYQDQRIDFYIDGDHFDTAQNSEYHVSPFHGAQSMQWIFGVGNYSTAANGPMFVGRASYSPNS